MLGGFALHMNYTFQPTISYRPYVENTRFNLLPDTHEYYAKDSNMIEERCLGIYMFSTISFNELVYQCITVRLVSFLEYYGQRLVQRKYA